MSIETINTSEAVNIFHQLMRPDAQIRVLRLIGDGKMGKSHLLTKVFPMLAQQDYQARYAILDLRNKLYNVPDLMHLACGLLDNISCNFYYTAHQEWTNRPKVKAEGIRAYASSLTFTAKDSSDDTQSRDRHLTTQFVRDLKKSDDKILLLLFDSINNASEYIQMWLTDTFLVQISQLSHLRVIVAGRFLPQPNGGYIARCKSYQLGPIKDIEEYITFCRKLDITLAEQSIRDFACACDYVPGFFAELVYPKFVKTMEV